MNANTWHSFDQDNMPSDGDYIARLVVPGRVDNPQYVKMVIRSGACLNLDASLVTHYVEPPDTNDSRAYRKGDLTWICPNCGKFIREPITNHIDNVCECGIEASMEWRDHSVHLPVED